MNLERLLECTMVSPPKPLTDAQIAAAEAKLDLRFPSDIRRLFMKWNGAKFRFYYYLRLRNLRYLPARLDPKRNKVLKTAIRKMVRDLFGEIRGDDFFPAGICDSDISGVDFFLFADNGFSVNRSDYYRREYYLAIDRKDPERYWMFDSWMGNPTLCSDSVSGYLNQSLFEEPCGDDFNDSDRKLKETHPDWFFGKKGPRRGRYMNGYLDDSPLNHYFRRVRVMFALENAEEFEEYRLKQQDASVDGLDFTAALPNGEELPMINVPPDSDASRQIWISRFPITNRRFLPVFGLDCSLKRRMVPAPFVVWRGHRELDRSLKRRMVPAEVSAADAETCCAILNDFFKGSLPDGYAFALPSDAEYRQALRYEKKHSPDHTEPLPGIRMRDRSGASASDANEKRPFFVVLTSKLS